MKHIFLTVCCLVIVTTTMIAQNEHKHELSLYGLGGYSPIGYTLDANGSKSVGLGGGAGLGYTFNISPSVGIVTGVEISAYNAEASYASDEISPYEVGTGLDMYRFTYSLRDYREKQNVTLFSIPIMAQYSLPLGASATRFYAAGGFKLGFPMGVKAKILSGEVKTEAYFAREDVTYNNLPQHCLYDYGNYKLPGMPEDVKLGFSAALALETGVRFALSDKAGIYAGAYFDYGLNNIRKEDSKHLVEYGYSNGKYAETLIHHSILTTGLVDKVNLLSVGLKVRISLNL
jgi:hypothetical protein